jgi:diguanylate cyclase (GGDEF)-like protein
MFDIDHFKRVNDRFGHQKGDEVLKKLSALVSSGVRKSDFLVRWGGEEFVIVMEESTLEAACEKAEELRRRIEEADFGIAGKLTCSFGVTMLDPEDTPDGALERVDRILYRAKKSGRNRVICDGQK